MVNAAWNATPALSSLLILAMDSGLSGNPRVLPLYPRAVVESGMKFDMKMDDAYATGEGCRITKYINNPIKSSVAMFRSISGESGVDDCGSDVGGSDDDDDDEDNRED